MVKKIPKFEVIEKKLFRMFMDSGFNIEGRINYHRVYRAMLDFIKEEFYKGD